MKKVLVINDGSKLPIYSSKRAAGCDVYAKVVEGDTGNTTIRPFLIVESGQSRMIKTGLFVAIPDGYEIQVRPRSGLAYKKMITVLNTPGTIDGDYRGEIGVILMNHGRESFIVNHGDRIAQLVMNKVEQIDWEVVTELPPTERGDGGFGHTGTN